AIYLSMRFQDLGQRDAHHAVLLVAIQGDKAQIINPWGREEVFKVSQLYSRLTGALLPAGELKPPAPPDPDAEKHYLENLMKIAKEQSEKNHNPEPIEPNVPQNSKK